MRCHYDAIASQSFCVVILSTMKVKHVPLTEKNNDLRKNDLHRCHAVCIREHLKCAACTILYNMLQITVSFNILGWETHNFSLQKCCLSVQSVSVR